ncbi:MAG: efflux transporter periplasmic adaptor subunit [Gammaproteobacteria bacterium RIFCSPHIGHO2_12_FULL_41_20]|nr:MAG: efflux transporter periplasmic adaptor subunit [Gammaproteobacteria bacterium RIFCSPHIGHO2_12_FULL_41_20]
MKWNLQLNDEAKKPMKKMLIAVGILFGSIFIYKGISGLFMHHYFATHGNPVMTVSTTTVSYSTWQPQLTAVGSLRATLGVNVTAQLGGMIQQAYFTPGSIVKEGTVLVQQNADTQIGQLQALQANEKLAQITYDRDKAQYKVGGVSKQQVDSDEQNLKSLQGQVAEQTATVVKLTIAAPFAGRLGISNVYPGQYLNPGDTVTTLQSLDPIYVDFYLPQQALSQLQTGQQVTFTVDAFPNQVFSGKITTINPIVDSSTRNVEVEATISNPKMQLLPGMFVNVTVSAGKSQRFLTVPQTAVSFNPYGDIAYLVKEQGKDKDGKPILAVTQLFVMIGETRGDQVAILQGLNAGDEVVTSGQLKLKNGSLVAINNKVVPSNNPSPVVPNQHGA